MKLYAFPGWIDFSFNVHDCSICTFFSVPNFSFVFYNVSCWSHWVIIEWYHPQDTEKWAKNLFLPVISWHLQLAIDVTFLMAAAFLCFFFCWIPFICLSYSLFFIKGEIWNRFNLIYLLKNWKTEMKWKKLKDFLFYFLEQSVNIVQTKLKTWWKIGCKIRKLWHFEVSQIFTKHFWKPWHRIWNIEIEWVDDVIASLLAIYF